MHIGSARDLENNWSCDLACFHTGSGTNSPSGLYFMKVQIPSCHFALFKNESAQREKKTTKELDSKVGNK